MSKSERFLPNLWPCHNMQTIRYIKWIISTLWINKILRMCCYSATCVYAPKISWALRILVTSLFAVCYYNPLLIRNQSWILTIHKDRKKPLEKTFLVFKKWVKNIQTAGYNGARTVYENYNVIAFKSCIQKFTVNEWVNFPSFHVL